MFIPFLGRKEGEGGDAEKTLSLKKEIYIELMQVFPPRFHSNESHWKNITLIQVHGKFSSIHNQCINTSMNAGFVISERSYSMLNLSAQDITIQCDSSMYNSVQNSSISCAEN